MWHMEREIAQDPDRLLIVAEDARESRERDTKWQIVAALVDLADRKDRIEPLLLQFAHDENEYIRRRALMALGKQRSPHVEALVEAAWNSGHEYQEYHR